MAAPDLAAPRVYAESVAPPRAVPHAASRERFNGVVTMCEMAGDFVVSMAGFVIAHAGASVLFGSAAPYPSDRTHVGAAATLGLLMVAMMRRERGYGGASGLLRIRDTERVLRISVQSLAMLYAAVILLGRAFSAADFLIAAVLVPVFLTVGRQIAFYLTGKARCGVHGPARAVIYGGGETGRHVASTLLDTPRLGLHPAVLIDDGRNDLSGSLPAMGYRDRSSVPISAGPVTAARLKSFQCDMLFIAQNALPAAHRDAAVFAARQAGCDVAICSAEASLEPGETSFDLDGLCFTRPGPRVSRGYEVTKRIADVVLSTALLLAIAPLLLIIAALVCLDSPGPALFIQKRVGRNGRLFDIFKFRSMTTEASKYSASPRSSADPRITRIGRFLRRLNLDELPQLFNVLNGTMSLVGPRPEMPFIADTYDARARRRFDARPGITGLWQLSADRSFPIHENLGYDFYYLRHRGFFLDLAILAHTLMFAMTGGI